MTFLVSPASAVRPRPSLAVAGLSRGEAELSLRLGRGCRAALPALAPDAVLFLQPAGGIDRDAAAGSDGALALSGDFGRIELDQGSRFLRALSGIDLGAAAGDAELRAWLQAGVCGRLQDTPFASAFAIDAPAAAPATAARDASVLRLTLRSGAHAVSSLARASPACWLRLLAGPAWQTRRSGAAAYAGLALRPPLRLARHALPARQLARLGPGDIIVPASPAFDVAGRGRIDWGPLHAAVAFRAPATLTILDLENTMDLREHEGAGASADTAYGENAADDGRENGGFEEQADAGHDDAMRAAPAADDALDGLPLTLDFELGRLNLSLGQLRSLAAGSTLLLEHADPASIAIVCGRRRIGRGEVVDVEGRLGVRIVEWSAA
jgi:type III secretion protein Q